MITEFGAEANRSGPVTEKGTYEFQAEFLRYHLDVFASKPFVSGALIWNLRDFRVKPGWAGGNPFPNPPVNRRGWWTIRGARSRPGSPVAADLPVYGTIPLRPPPRPSGEGVAQRPAADFFADPFPCGPPPQRLDQESRGASASSSSVPCLVRW